MDLARAPRRARLTARKKGSGYENDHTEVADMKEEARGIGDEPRSGVERRHKTKTTT